MESLEQKLSDAEKVPQKPEHISWTRRVLYLLNHALSCFVTDVFAQTPISTLTQKYLPKAGKFFESHEGHHHRGHEEETHKGFMTNAKHWVIGEAVGDLGAVPITATMQHYMPKLMIPLRKMMEPVVGWYFKKGSARDAKKWAISQNLNPDGPEAVAKAKEFYEYELSHMGPVVVWNILSAAINIAVQKMVLKVPDRWQTLAAAKGFSTLFSNGLLLGARAASPRTFEELEYKGERVFKKLAGTKEVEVNKNPNAPPQEADKNASVKEKAAPATWAERSSHTTPIEATR